MEIVKFKEMLEDRTGLSLNNDYILFNDYELYNSKDDISKHFKSLDDVLKEKIDDVTIEDLIKAKDKFVAEDFGGRGASSSSGQGGKLFSGNEGRSGGNLTPLPPSKLNALKEAGGRYKSLEKTASVFGKEMLDANREYTARIDADGFVHEFGKGQKTSVTHIEKEGQYTIHNHPVKGLTKEAKAKGRGVKYYNAPSYADLKNVALGKGKGTIIASSGNRSVYIFSKSNGFDGKGFIKAMRKATGKDYDRGVDAFLRKNQKAYKYKYKKIKF